MLKNKYSEEVLPHIPFQFFVLFILCSVLQERLTESVCLVSCACESMNN